MLILFDQGTPAAIREYLPEHNVVTAHERNWSTLSNGELLHVAEEAGFEVFVTTDTHLAEQQNLRNRKLAIVVLGRNRWKSILARIQDVVAAINGASPGTYTRIDI
jgi:hypothetical protein